MRAYFSEEFGQQKFHSGAGSAIPLDIFKSILVDGFGDQIVTSITRVNTTATVTLTSDHGIPIKFSRFEISGCTQPEYNGIFDVLITGDNTFTYEVTGAPATPATAAVDIHSKVPAAGWSMPHAKSDTAMALKQGGGNEYFCRFDNTLTNALIMLQGFRTMTDKDTGTDKFPRTPQCADDHGFKIYSSAARSSSSSNDRPWIIIADDTNFYISVNTNGASYSTVNTTGGYSSLNGFVDLIPSFAGQDALTAVYAPRTATQPHVNTLQTLSHIVTPSSTSYCLSLSESSDGTVTTEYGYNYTTGSDTAHPWSEGCAYPHPVTGAFHVADIKVLSGTYATGNGGNNNTQVERGKMPKMYSIKHSSTFDHLSTFDGTGDLVGKRLLILKTATYGVETLFEV